MLLALDIGTTSITARVLSESGCCLLEKQVLNPQIQFGCDVLRRIDAALHGESEKLQKVLVDGINNLVITLLEEAQIRPDLISAFAAAANPAVSILIQNKSVNSILTPPYKPIDCSAIMMKPDEIGLDLPVPLYLFPLVNGFVGGDLVAFLFGQDMPNENTLYIDIGTNGEIALFSNGNWWVTSVAAGPAFEGGDIRAGMLYGSGAIYGCRLNNERFDYEVVGDIPPRGICGSGLVEIIATSLESGLIDRHGSIVEPEHVKTNLSRYIVSLDGNLALQLYRDAKTSILLEQKDIRNFQLAKAAVFSGVNCLLKKAEIEAGEIADIVITGAFGFSLTKKTLKRVAMLPENMIDKVRFEPGGVLQGVQRMLMLDDGPERVENLAKKLKPYPLSGTPAFEKAFLSAIDF
ncbi:MAG: hypothetical protein C0623_11890 [Desulfuromonas sp.]|nr:MAG: hypothetical protein C0623_11890 [Desulfuromonas sp.]